MAINKHLIALLIGWFGISGLSATEFKIATLAPEGTAWLRTMRSAAETIERATDARVKFKFYPGGVMGNDQTVLRKIKLRQLHGAAFTGGALSRVEPAAGIYSLPMLFRSMEEVRYVRAQMDVQIKARLKDKGLIALGMGDGGFAYLMSDKPAQDIRTMQEHRVWVPEGDTNTASVFAAVGLNPVALPLGDVYTGLQTGLIDTFASTPSGAIAFQWHTRIRHMVDLPLVYLNGYFVVDNNQFNELTKDDQKIVETHIVHAFQSLDRINQQDNDDARKALLGQGIQIQQLSPDQAQLWRDIASQTVKKILANEGFDKTLYDVLSWHLASFRSQVKINN